LIEREPRTDRTPPPPDAAPRRWPTLVLLAVLLGTMVLPRFFLAAPARDAIRYDELLRFVREGRVEWVIVGGAEIEGAYREGKVPPPAAARAGDRGAAGDAPAGARGPAPAPRDRPRRFVTPRVDDPSLVPLLLEHRVAFRGAAPDAASGQWTVWLLSLLLPLGLALFLWTGMLRRIGGQAAGAVSFGKSRGKLVTERDVKVTFADVAGVDEAKEELQEIIEFLRYPEKYRRIGAKLPKGVLLVGPPGTGKTLLARAVAGEARVPFIQISGSEFVEMFVGVGAARARDLFEQARKSAPCIVFIDELDALGRSRGGPTVGGANDEREQTLNQLLVEMDGFTGREAVIVLAATNRPEILDPALLRPGRFDRQVLVDRPDRKGRLAILKVHAKNVPLGPDVDLELLARRTPGFAGADLANLVNEAALLAARHGRERVTAADFGEALERVVAGLEKKSRVMTDEERRRVAYHEVGHALCGTLLGSREKVHKISIVPRGMAALGYTMQLPTDDRFLATESELRTRIVGLLGGRAAELVVFGEASTGAQNDLVRATEIARAMVVEFGMSEDIGPVSVSGERRPLLLGGGTVGVSREVGSALADRIDAEVRRIVVEAEARARALLEAHRDALERVAERLLEQEQLEGEELDALLGTAAVAPGAS
jgi:cell division protease FtsH